MSSNVPYVRKAQWPKPLEHLEEFITSTGHDLTVDHNKGERIEDKYAELQQKMDMGRKPSSSDGHDGDPSSSPR